MTEKQEPAVAGRKSSRCAGNVTERQTLAVTERRSSRC
jgi:hypothetical protein